MGLFNNLFRPSEPRQKKVLPWTALASMNQIDAIIERSKTTPQIVFKHSTRCGISRMVMNGFVEAYNFNKDDFDLYYLDILKYREISDQLSQQFQIQHESPQLLIIKNGTLVEHASHGAINDLELTTVV